MGQSKFVGCNQPSNTTNPGDDVIAAESSFSFPHAGVKGRQKLPAGLPHEMFSLGGHIVCIEVNTETGVVKVVEYIAFHVTDRVISRVSAEGQIEGGIVTGLGYSMLENMKHNADSQWVSNFADYILPTANEIPKSFHNVFLEIPSSRCIGLYSLAHFSAARPASHNTTEHDFLWLRRSC